MKQINLTALIIILSISCFAQQKTEHIDFSSPNWKTLGSAKVQKQDAQTSTSISEGVGIAYLDGLTFENGVIECDLFSPTDKAYLGLVFRIGALDNFECIYFQPHTSGKWDAIQYDPIFNSSPTWQLFSSKGYQAVAEIPVQKWFHVKIKVLNDSAKVYLNKSKTPALSVKLKHKIKSGSAGVYSYHPAVFKNLKITKLETNPKCKNALTPHATNQPYISQWHISEPYDNYYQAQSIQELSKSQNKWSKINADEDNLINLNQHFTKTPKGNTVLAKVTIHSESTQNKQLKIGYSDKVRVCLNSDMLFKGDNSYKASARYEDRGYVLDGQTTIELPLKKGVNELLIELAEDKFGWGFIAQLDNMKGIEKIE